MNLINTYNFIQTSITRAHERNTNEPIDICIGILQRVLQHDAYEPLLQIAIQRAPQDTNLANKITELILKAFAKSTRNKLMTALNFFINDQKFEAAFALVDTINISDDKKAELRLKVITACELVNPELALRLR